MVSSHQGDKKIAHQPMGGIQQQPRRLPPRSKIICRCHHIKGRGGPDKHHGGVKKTDSAGAGSKHQARGNIGEERARSKAPDHTLNREKKKKSERMCKNCKKSGYHEDDECFTLEKNANKRPACYVKIQK